MKKILVVDDDPGILDSLSLVLKDAGYQVEVSEKIRLEDLINLNGKQPDLLILDVLLAGFDSRELVKKFKTREGTKDIPIIMISAHPTAEKSSLEAGADDFIHKPFEVDDLLMSVKKLV